MLDGVGRRVRLDDAVGRSEWTVLHTPGETTAGARSAAGVAVFELRPAGSDPAPGALVDVENVLIGQWARSGTGTVVVRPDAVVFDAVRRGATPAPPPASPPPRVRRVADDASVPAPI